jgi:hypothetical protein
MGKTNQARTDERNGYRPLSHEPQRRLDVNNLLNKIKSEKNQSKKTNLLIFSGTVVAVLVFISLLSIVSRI